MAEVKGWPLRGEWEWDFLTGNLKLKFTERLSTGDKHCYCIENDQRFRWMSMFVAEGYPSAIMELTVGADNRALWKVFAETILAALKEKDDAQTNP